MPVGSAGHAGEGRFAGSRAESSSAMMSSTSSNLNRVRHSSSVHHPDANGWLWYTSDANRRLASSSGGLNLMATEGSNGPASDNTGRQTRCTARHTSAW